MCDACNILKVKTADLSKEQKVLYIRTVASLLKEHTVQIKLCDDHDRVFFLRGERGFLRTYPPVAKAIQCGAFTKTPK